MIPQDGRHLRAAVRENCLANGASDLVPLPSPLGVTLASRCVPAFFRDKGLGLQEEAAVVVTEVGGGGAVEERRNERRRGGGRTGKGGRRAGEEEELEG